MNWPWSFQSTPRDGCENIEPLLSLYADRMTSADEARRVEAHLLGCEDCRESLAWMQATRQALAGRPIAVPPADLHSRIAEAIAASSGVPSVLRPARSFTLRPAYAAAASVAAVGAVLSYSLLHSLPEAAVKPAAKPAPVVASVPRTENTASAPSHSAPLPSAPLPSAPLQLRPLVARSIPAAGAVKPAVKHLQPLANTLPVIKVVPPEHVATVPANLALLPGLPAVKPVSRVFREHNKVASAAAAPGLKRLLFVPQPFVSKPFVPKKAAPTKSQEAPLVAKTFKEPVRIPLNIPSSTLTVDPPPVKTASAVTSPKSDNILASIVPRINMQNAVHAAPRYMVREASLGVSSMANALNKDEHLGSYGAIYTPTK